MTSLDFLYIALGGGFVILVIFLSVMLLHLTLVLRDVSKVSANLREVSEKIKETVFEPLKALSELSVGFSYVHDWIEKIRAKFEKNDEDGEGDEVSQSDDKEDKGDKGSFSVRKIE